MTPKAQMDALARLVADKPALAASLQSAPTSGAVADILEKAAQENGLDIDKTALAALLAEQTAAAGAKLSDADLDQVAGGGAMGVFYSFLTVGVGCIVVSIKAAQAHGDCGKALT